MFKPFKKLANFALTPTNGYFTLSKLRPAWLAFAKIDVSDLGISYTDVPNPRITGRITSSSDNHSNIRNNIKFVPSLI